jgi:hypothetical protein
MNRLEESVHAFRLLRTSTTKATDHELQKYDIFTRYGQSRVYLHVQRIPARPQRQRSRRLSNRLISRPPARTARE